MGARVGSRYVLLPGAAGPRGTSWAGCLGWGGGKGAGGEGTGRGQVVGDRGEMHKLMVGHTLASRRAEVLIVGAPMLTSSWYEWTTPQSHASVGRPEASNLSRLLVCCQPSIAAQPALTCGEAAAAGAAPGACAAADAAPPAAATAHSTLMHQAAHGAWHRRQAGAASAAHAEMQVATCMCCQRSIRAGHCLPVIHAGSVACLPRPAMIPPLPRSLF